MVSPTRWIWLLALLLVGCTATIEPLPPGDRPARSFKPADKAKAIIIAVHGFNDHSRAFEDFGTYAASLGYSVDAYDQNGFGNNDNFGRWPGGQALVDDLIDRIGKTRTESPNTPLFVLGESMGAAVSILALAGAAETSVDGLIMSAPAVWGGEAMNPFYRAVLWVGSRVAPNWKFSGRGLGIQASDNIPMLRELGTDPLFIKETRLQAIQGVVELMGDARLAGPSLKLPRLLLGGTMDQVVPPEAILSFATALAPEACRKIIYPDGWHLLLRDLNRRKVWDDILAWIADAGKSRIGASCS